MPVQLIENHHDDTVTIGARRLAGWIEQDAHCEGCDTPIVFSLAHLAPFCPACNRWLERHCDDAECLYCVGRPRQPLAA